LTTVDAVIHRVQVNCGKHLFAAGFANDGIEKPFGLPFDQDISDIKYDCGWLHALSLWVEGGIFKNSGAFSFEKNGPRYR
tara:strand:- start:140793 stop:141032 length:240 start_codon:yes stop_codon:yes gene_type:complete